MFLKSCSDGGVWGSQTDTDVDAGAPHQAGKLVRVTRPQPENRWSSRQNELATRTRALQLKGEEGPGGTYKQA